MTWINFIIGALLLTLGRRLFWVFVAAIGALLAINIVSQAAPGELSDAALLIIALAAGLIGAALAMFLQRLALALAGFVAGVYLTMQVLALLGWNTQDVSWLLYLLGGVIVAGLITLLFDWALVFVSSLVGALLIAQTFNFAPSIELILVVLLFLAGIAIQFTLVPPGGGQAA